MQALQLGVEQDGSYLYQLCRVLAILGSSLCRNYIPFSISFNFYNT